MTSSLGYLDYTWADVTFSGGGFGVVQTSLGWDPLNERVSGFENWLSSAGLKTLTIDGVAAMVAFYPRRGGRHVLVCKRQLAKDSAGRSGRYLVRVFADPSQEITLAQAMDLAVATVPTLEWDATAPPRRNAPAPVLGSVERAPVEPRALAALIHGLDSGSSITLSGPNPCGIVAAAVELLPAAMTSRVSVSSYHLSGPPPTILLGESDLLKVSAADGSPLELSLADEVFARDYLNFARELGVPDVDDVRGWWRWVLAQRRRRAEVDTLPLQDVGLELADDALPADRRAELIEVLCAREFAGSVTTMERSQARAAMGHDAAMAVTSALLARPLDVLVMRDPVATLSTWGATDGEIVDLMRARWQTLSFDPADARDAEQTTLLNFLADFCDHCPERLGDIVGIEWVLPEFVENWDDAAKILTREFWLAREEPDARLATVAATLLWRYTDEVRALVGELPQGSPRQLRVEAALRCLGKGEMWRAFVALTSTVERVTAPEPEPERKRRRGLLR